MTYAIDTYDLTKHYSGGKIKALQDCTLKVEPGKIFSLLGPNGAGKTTLLKILIGIIHPTKGRAQILGQPIENYLIHSKIGYLAENHRFPEFLTAKQVLFYYGKMTGLNKNVLREKIPELLKIVKLNGWENTKIRKFSKGMLQRLGLAHSLIHEPELVFLDEPTDGIDPVGRKEIRDLLKNLRDQGKTIFLNSHLLSEVERVSDEVAILKNGQLLQQGTVEDFISIKQQFILHLENGTTSIQDICKLMEIPLTVSPDSYTVATKDDAQLNVLIDRLRQQNTLIKAIIPRKITLEDYFIEVIGTENGEKK